MEVQPRRTQDLRGLKALVGFLGVLVILGTALVIGIVIHRIYAKPAALAPAPAPAPGMVPGMSPALPPTLPFTLPPASGVLARGEHISGIAGAGGEVAIWTSGPAGDRVLLLDPATGKITVAIAASP